MKIGSHKEPFGYLVIDDVYSDEELRLMWHEIKFLHPKMQPAGSTYSATDKEGNPIKQNKSIFLDTTYTNRSVSDLMALNKKVFSQEVRDALAGLHPSYANALTANSYTTLLNYYGDDDSYKPHQDMNMYTFITFFVPDNPEYTGGDFVFTDFGITIEQKKNRVVVFPGCINHQVSAVKLLSSEATGRFSMAQFLSYTDRRVGV